MVKTSLTFQIINKITDELFQTEFKHLDEQVQALIWENIRLGGSQDGFRYHGLTFSCLDPSMRSRGTYTNLESVLFPVMEKLAADRTTLIADQQRISQALALSLRSCNSWQDIRDALPNSLKDLVEQCAQLDRTRPEAYTLADNPRAYKQYMKLREKIDFYAASRLLY